MRIPSEDMSVPGTINDDLLSEVKMWGSQGVGWSHLRGPCRRRKPLPLARVEVPDNPHHLQDEHHHHHIIVMVMFIIGKSLSSWWTQVNLLFEACMRHETLWQLLVQKGIKYYHSVHHKCWHLDSGSSYFRPDFRRHKQALVHHLQVMVMVMTKWWLWLLTRFKWLSTGWRGGKEGGWRRDEGGGWGREGDGGI